MKINGLHHIAVNTVDFEKSIRFYTDILKMEFVHEADLGTDYAAYIRYGRDQYMELFRKKQTVERQTKDDAEGLRHIAFDVDDVDVWNEYLKEKKVPFNLEVTNVDAIKKRVLLIEAPDHVIIELCQSV